MVVFDLLKKLKEWLPFPHDFYEITTKIEEEKARRWSEAAQGKRKKGPPNKPNNKSNAKIFEPKRKRCKKALRELKEGIEMTFC